jgi:hypothetical protein
MTPPLPAKHHWVTAAAFATLLEGRRIGDHYVARCPAHDDTHPSLDIAEKLDKYGNPMTVMICRARGCAVEAICAAVGIPVRALFSVQQGYAQETARLPRTHSPRLAHIKATNTLPLGGVAAVMLEEMIRSDPDFLRECPPARQTLWELVSASPALRRHFRRVLAEVGIPPQTLWHTLEEEWGNGPSATSQDIHRWPSPMTPPHTWGTGFPKKAPPHDSTDD